MNFSIQPTYIEEFRAGVPTRVRIIDPLDNISLECFCERCSCATDYRIQTAKDMRDLEMAGPFSDFEWRFFDCPEDQHHWCDIYEYTRNNPRAVQAVAGYKSFGYWAWEALFPSPSHKKLASHFFDAFPEFPRKAFLTIDDDVRRARCAELDKERLSLRAQQLPIKTRREVTKGMLALEVAADITEDEWHRFWTNINGKLGKRRVAANRLLDLSLLQLYRHLKSWPSVLKFVTEKRVRLFSDDPDHLCRCGNRAVEDMKSVFRRVL